MKTIFADCWRNFGLKVGNVGVVKFEERIRESVDDMADPQDVMDPLLIARRKLREEFSRLHKKVLDISRNDEMCRLLMTIPGVGPPDTPAVGHHLTYPVSGGSLGGKMDIRALNWRSPPYRVF